MPDLVRIADKSPVQPLADASAFMGTNPTRSLHVIDQKAVPNRTDAQQRVLQSPLFRINASLGAGVNPADGRFWLMHGPPPSGHNWGSPKFVCVIVSIQMLRFVLNAVFTAGALASFGQTVSKRGSVFFIMETGTRCRSRRRVWTAIPASRVT